MNGRDAFFAYGFPSLYFDAETQPCCLACHQVVLDGVALLACKCRCTVCKKARPACKCVVADKAFFHAPCPATEIAAQVYAGEVPIDVFHAALCKGLKDVTRACVLCLDECDLVRASNESP